MPRVSRSLHAAVLLGVALIPGACASGGARTAPAPVAVVPGPVVDSRTTLRIAIDSMADAPEFRNANWGILVVDPERGDTLYSRNAGKLFMPASNQKLLTGSTALAQLGPGFRFVTTFIAGGPVRAGTLDGDLLVVGRGDPSVSDHMRAGDALAPLLAVADSLRARGITRIAGDVVASGDAFPDSSLGYGWAWDDAVYSYSAGVDELYFNEGFTNVVVRGAAAAGSPPAVSVAPLASYPSVRVVATTDASLSPGTNRITYTRDGATLVVGGSIAPGDSTSEEVSYVDQRGAYLAALRAALARRGIAVAGRAQAARASAAPTRPAADTMLRMESPPLSEILPALEKPSQNQIAEILFKTLGLERTGVGSADSGRVVVERQLRAWGADSGGFAVRDGSGLSRHDYVTPETIVRVLDAMRRAPTFRTFYDALPIAGVDGTIGGRMKGTPAAGNVHAKTGYVDKARSLSGYVTTADGRMLLFTMLCNNWTVPVRRVERVQDAVAIRLASLRTTTASR